jgi:hypothetical protein
MQVPSIIYLLWEHSIQLNHLTRYIPGLGLEDLEMCKCTFLKSNVLTDDTLHKYLSPPTSYCKLRTMMNTRYMQIYVCSISWHLYIFLLGFFSWFFVQQLQTGPQHHQWQSHHTHRWTPEDPDWQSAGHPVANQQLCTRHIGRSSCAHIRADKDEQVWNW